MLLKQHVDWVNLDMWSSTWILFSKRWAKFVWAIAWDQRMFVWAIAWDQGMFVWAIAWDQRMFVSSANFRSAMKDQEDKIKYVKECEE